MLNKDKLTTFTIDDQIKLEVLHQKHQERTHIRVVNGKILQSKREKSQELIEIENRVKEMFVPVPSGGESLIEADGILILKTLIGIGESIMKHLHTPSSLALLHPHSPKTNNN